jgi:TolB-like protein
VNPTEGHVSRTQEPHLHLEVGHILFLDIVGYSKLLSDEQKELVQELNQIVRETEHFRAAEAEGKLTRLPTGDGMVLVFTNNPEAPVECALEISKALQSHPRLKVRMGIHSGPVNPFADVNDQSNLAGAGINVAQRVMYCGDAGHILLSKHFAEDLEHYAHWRPHLHEVGEVTGKHGLRVPLVNLYTDQLGNPALPTKLRQARAAFRLKSAAVAALLLIAVLGVGFWTLRRSQEKSISAGGAIPFKSIAVLPFENLSADPENAYFATGVQNEILTRLAKIAALKVISHTSTQQYPSHPGNLSEIARQLGVANVLEGSVQRAADQVHINVQLIRAATDEHLWAESYDRKLENIFGVEADVATAVADALKAKLSGGEQRALQKRSTNSQEAYEAYLRGLAYSLRPFYESEDNRTAIKYFGEAARLDPKFALAWAWLGSESALGYFNRIDTDFPTLREAAKHAAAKAIELQPDLAEAYLAQGYSHYYGEDDYDSAIASFEKATSLSPNNSDVFRALGLIYRRKGEWQRSLDYLREATELDPRNTLFLSDLEGTLMGLRQYSAALKIDDQILDIVPGNPDAQWEKISNYQAQGNLPAAAQVLSTLHSKADYSLLAAQVDQWIYERRYADAIASLKEALPKSDAPWWFKLRYGERLARLQQLSGDSLGARATWQQLQTEAESVRRAKGENFSALQLASAYLALGGDEIKAFAILEHVTAMPFFSKDVWARSFWTVGIAEFAVQAGKKDLALEQLATSARNAVGVDYGDLKFNPVWDPLRGDPRFEKIVAALAAN